MSCLGTMLLMTAPFVLGQKYLIVLFQNCHEHQKKLFECASAACERAGPTSKSLLRAICPLVFSRTGRKSTKKNLLSISKRLGILPFEWCMVDEIKTRDIFIIFVFLFFYARRSPSSPSCPLVRFKYSYRQSMYNIRPPFDEKRF